MRNFFHTSKEGTSFVNIATLSENTLAVNHPITILDQITSYLPRVQISPKLKILLKGKSSWSKLWHSRFHRSSYRCETVWSYPLRNLGKRKHLNIRFGAQLVTSSFNKQKKARSIKHEPNHFGKSLKYKLHLSAQ